MDRDSIDVQVSPLTANRFATDPLLYTTPNYHEKKAHPTTEGVTIILSANWGCLPQSCLGGVHGPCHVRLLDHAHCSKLSYMPCTEGVN